MTKTFNKLEEIEKYYDKESNTYIFKEYGMYINLVIFNFDLNVKSNIYAWNIYARNINALNIHAKDICVYYLDANDIKVHDINAQRINANNISYYAVCYAYENIKCKSIKGRKYNAKHFALDGHISIDGSIETIK